MDTAEFIVELATFFLLNTPVYTALNKYILRPRGRAVQWITTAVFWVAAFFTQNFAAFISIMVLIFFVYSRSLEEPYISSRVWDFNPMDVAFSVLATIIFTSAIVIINNIFIELLYQVLKYQAKPQDIVTSFSNADSLYKVLLFLTIAIFAPVVEEYIFRYYLYGRILLHRMPAIAAALVSSAIFAAMHYNLGGVPSFFGLGLFNCYIYHKKGYYGAVAAHFTFNLLGILALVFPSVLPLLT